MKRIFIGGMGRSGTTILLHALYCHGDIYAVPVETKFLVEEDGFDDLITAVTARFSSAGAPVAIRRFQHLMYEQVTGRVDSKFRQLAHPPGTVFPDYLPALDAFMGELALSGGYFASRAPLLAAVRRFVAALFDAETKGSDKAIWAEKTPSNFWRLPFLRELWPDCYFIHAVRDPRAIFLSLLERRWLPPEVGDALTIFENHMAALLTVRRRHAGDPRFIETRLEDLVEAPWRTLDRLTEALEISRFGQSAMSALTGSMDRYYADRGDLAVNLTASEWNEMEERLTPSAVGLGYDARWRGPCADPPSVTAPAATACEVL